MGNHDNNSEDKDSEAGVRCPFCRKSPMEGEECEHLFIHGDDLRTETIVENTCGSKIWQRILALSARDLPEFAADFLDQHFGRLVKIQRSCWEGGAPGLSGVYCFVWTRNRRELQNQIHAFLEDKLRSLQKLKTSKKKRK